MKIQVKFFTTLREITGKKEEEIELSGSTTIKELLTQLSKKYGREFVNYLYDEKGEIRTHIQILINGRDIDVFQGLETKLKEGDTIAIFPPVGGG
ncbi:MAG: ubiquitin-like small modifier protein 1 [Candidatus Bathyarchaeaceae archaeon]